jgi:hypothetical protein
MKHALLLSLTLLTSIANAQWQSLGQDAENKITYYVDPSTLRTEGQLRSVWLLYDMKYYTPSEKGKAFRSMRVFRQYECGQDRARTLATDVYRQPMATGELLEQNEEPSEWSFVRPQTIDAAVSAAVCQQPK